METKGPIFCFFFMGLKYQISGFCGFRGDGLIRFYGWDPGVAGIGSLSFFWGGKVWKKPRTSGIWMRILFFAS